MACDYFRTEYKFANDCITSLKPSLGPGNGSIHSYVTHHRDRGYAAFAFCNRATALDILRRISEAGVVINANMLKLSAFKDNMYENRNIYFFFKEDADAIVFKMYLADVPAMLTTNTHILNEPKVISMRIPS